MSKNYYYKDVNAETPTKRANVTDYNAILQGVRNLIRTRPGERPFLVDYGIALDDSIWELMDDLSGLEIYNEIIEKLKRYEPRVTLNTSTSSVIALPDENEFQVQLFIEIEGFEGQQFEVTEPIKR